ncbi:MAG TPA: NBR1-Ig-like domain-containing protein [Methylomirabilota bacterium]|nr:NBR1-Ig-like domain-containing protein [Methylomirabilota bacterium]
MAGDGPRPTRRARSLPLGLLLLLVALAPRALAGPPRFIDLKLPHPGSYDYAPSILYDDEERKWKAWWCGRREDKSQPGDDVYYAESVDRLTWSRPLAVAFTPQKTRALYLGDACDPSVLKNPGGTVFGGWKYVMYHTGSARADDTDATIHVVMSNDGKQWQRYDGNPLIKCEAAGHYGCGQPSVVRLADRFVLTYAKSTGAFEGIMRAESTDGVRFSNHQQWCVPHGCRASPGIDIMHDPSGYYTYYIGYVAEGEAILAGATTLGGPMTLLQKLTPPGWIAGDRTTGASVAGFFRTGTGFRPPGKIWTAFGYPGLARFTNLKQTEQELKAAEWDVTNLARQEAISVPSSVPPGGTFPATITLRNIGTAAWTAESHSLGFVETSQNRWGVGRIRLPRSPVRPGETVTFSFTGTAPATPGSFAFNWQMVQESVEWFGDVAAATVTVTGAPASQRPRGAAPIRPSPGG